MTSCAPERRFRFGSILQRAVVGRQIILHKGVDVRVGVNALLLQKSLGTPQDALHAPRIHGQTGQTPYLVEECARLLQLVVRVLMCQRALFLALSLLPGHDCCTS